MSDAPRAGERVPITVSLLDRRSVTGASVVLAVALIFILGVPALNDTVRGENPFEAGEPYVVAGSYGITPAPGWELSLSNDLFTALEKSGAALVLTVAVEASQTAEEAMEAAVEALDRDPATTWVYGDTRDFVTDAGDPGLELAANGAEGVQMTWVVTNGAMNITVLGRSPAVVWESVTMDFDSMVRSIVFGTGEEGP